MKLKESPFALCANRSVYGRFRRLAPDAVVKIGCVELGVDPNRKSVRDDPQDTVVVDLKKIFALKTDLMISERIN